MEMRLCIEKYSYLCSRFQKCNFFLVSEMKTIKRPDYLNRLKSLKETPDIKILTGIRRCGKSKLMQSYIQWLRETDENNNVIFIDFALLENEHLKEYHSLNNYVTSRFDSSKNNYLCIDEVQLCPHFELTINSLYTTGNYDIYLTGSNAFLLSSDLATLFTGRFIEISVFPFSFREFCDYFEISTDFQDAFEEYVTNGGLSGSYPYKNEEDRCAYIKDVYNTIVKRDLIDRYRLSAATDLSKILEYMMDNTSNICSPNGIASSMTSGGMPTCNKTVESYLEYLCNAFVLYKVKRYDIRGKKYLQSLDKYYLADSGIRYAMLGRRNIDWGRIYENIVYLELKRRGFDVYVGKLYQKEIDFVAMKGNEKIYVQVSDDITNPQTFEREYSPLLQIKEGYPKMIIARTRKPKYDYYGIAIVDIAEWLHNIV